MDFSQFDSKSAGDAGAWMHVRSPINGDLLWADSEQKKPCRVQVLGIEGAIGQSLLKAERDKMKGEVKETDMAAQTAPLIVGFENINRGKKPATAPDDAEWFLGLQKVVGGDFPTFVEQVRSFSVRRANILGNASRG